MADYSAMSLTELKEEAKKRGLKGVSTMRKQELAEVLSAQEGAAEPAQAAEQAVSAMQEEDRKSVV